MIGKGAFGQVVRAVAVGIGSATRSTTVAVKMLRGRFVGSYRESSIKGILCDLFILTLELIIVLIKYCTYNKPIPTILHVKTLQNFKMRYKYQ